VGTHVLKLTHELNIIKNVGTHVLKLTHEHLLVSCSVLTAASFNPRAQGASRGAKDATRARNRRKTHRGARSTCAGGRVKSVDVDSVPPTR
jgi:hypothetical protein